MTRWYWRTLVLMLAVYGTPGAAQAGLRRCPPPYGPPMEPNFGYFSTCWRRCPAVYGMTPALPEGAAPLGEMMEAADPIPADTTLPGESLPNPEQYPEVPEAGTAPTAPTEPVIIEPKGQIQGRKTRPEIDPWAAQPKSVSKTTSWPWSWWKEDKPAPAEAAPSVSHQAAHAMRVEQRNSVISQLPAGTHVTPPPRPLATAQRPQNPRVPGPQYTVPPNTAQMRPNPALGQSASRQPIPRVTRPAAPRVAPISSQAPAQAATQDPRMIGTSRATPVRAVVPAPTGQQQTTWAPQQGRPTSNWPAGYVVYPAPAPR
jgi:hypothetical protein